MLTYLAVLLPSHLKKKTIIVVVVSSRFLQILYKQFFKCYFFLQLAALDLNPDGQGGGTGSK